MNIAHVFPECSSLFVLFTGLGVAVAWGLLHVVLGRSCMKDCLDCNCSALSVRILSPVLLLQNCHDPSHTWALDLFFPSAMGRFPFAAISDFEKTSFTLAFSFHFSV